VRRKHLARLVLLAGISVASAEDFVLGISVAPKEHCNAARGICVTSVRREGAAGRAGIQTGDVLLRLGDSAISGLGDIGSRLRNAPANLALHAELLRAGATIDVPIAFNASDEASNGKPMLAPIQDDFDVLPRAAPAVAAHLASGMKEGETRIAQDHEVLTFTHRSASAAVQLIGTVQVPLSHIDGTDIWIVQLRRPSWDEALLSYSIIDDGKAAAGGSGYFRGNRAPKLALEAANLRGEVRGERIHSSVLGENRYVTIYLPPTRSRDLPMLVMADGQSCQEFARVVEPLILAGKVRPFAIVGVHASTNAQAAGSYDPAKNRRAQEYLPFEDPVIAERHMRFVVEEVIPWATQRFHLANRRSDRAVVGFSNGAAFAIDAAMSHGELFADALAFSPNWDGSNRDGSDPNRPLTLPRFHFAAGKLESNFETMARRANSRIQAWGANSEIRIYDSGHEMLMWKRALADFLPEVFPPRK
jgi:enterochelin esterase-like enzyme